MKLDHFSEREEFYRIRRLSPVACLLVSALLNVANQIMFASIGEVKVKILELGVAVRYRRLMIYGNPNVGEKGLSRKFS